MRTYDKTLSLIAAAVCAGAVLPQAVLAGGAQKSDLYQAAKASTVEGMELYGKNGDELGTIDDIVVSVDTGKIDSFIVGTGFLGIGGATHRVSMDMIDNRNVKSRDIHTNLDGADLDAAPIFDEEAFDRQRDSGRNGVDKKIKIVDTFNNEVEDKDGAKQGEIHDWIVDVKNGYVPFAIVRVLSPSPTGHHNYFAIATSRLVGVESSGEVVFDVDAGEFLNAEHIDSNEPLKRDDDADVYQFRYDPDAVMSQK